MKYAQPKKGLPFFRWLHAWLVSRQLVMRLMRNTATIGNNPFNMENRVRVFVMEPTLFEVAKEIYSSDRSVISLDGPQCEKPFNNLYNKLSVLGAQRINVLVSSNDVHAYDAISIIDEVCKASTDALLYRMQKALRQKAREAFGYKYVMDDVDLVWEADSKVTIDFFGSNLLSNEHDLLSLLLLTAIDDNKLKAKEFYLKLHSEALRGHLRGDNVKDNRPEIETISSLMNSRTKILTTEIAHGKSNLIGLLELTYLEQLKLRLKGVKEPKVDPTILEHAIRELVDNCHYTRSNGVVEQEYEPILSHKLRLHEQCS